MVGQGDSLRRGRWTCARVRAREREREREGGGRRIVYMCECILVYVLEGFGVELNYVW